MRRPLARRASTTLTLAAALALPAAAPAAAQSPITLTSGHADWGVKESFRNYVQGPIAHGQITVSEGATANADGTFRFGFVSGTYDPVAHAVVADFDGTVRFTGHDSGSGPVLDLTISDPRVETAGDAGTLIADMRSRSMATGEYTDHPDAEVATLDLSGSTMTPGAEAMAITDIAATLTAEGAAAFGGFYGEGTELDPVHLLVGYGTPDPDPDPDPGSIPDPGPQSQPQPGPQPQPDVQPAAVSARISALSARRTVRRRTVKVARVASTTGAWTVRARKRVAFRLAGKRHSAAVLAPSGLADGERATVRLKLRKRTLAALAGRRAKVKLPLRLLSGDQVVRRTIRVMLVR